MKKYYFLLIFSFILFSGIFILAQENSSISLTQLFSGQYENTKFYITLADPEGIGAAAVNKANGDWVLSAGRSCLKQFNTGTVTLLPEDFPLKGSITDCQGNKYETSIFPLGTFPVAELGNCANEKDCEAYCDLPENMEPCLDFAEENNLMPQEEIAIARKMLAAGQTSGPGGCRGQAECGEYCNDINHLPECLTFAERHGLMSQEELEEAKKVAKALEQGLTPPNNCKSKEECDSYCSQPDNMAECFVFAEAAGLIPPDELEEAKMVLAAIQKGVKPPPCGGRDACDAYCSEPEHLEECIAFAEAAGFMTHEEAEMVKLTGGQGPGGCRGKDACEAFCEDPANGEECINFALQYGFMEPEQAEQAKKMLAAGFTSGPGGCKGQEECEAYCDDISHMTECVDFAEKAGFMSTEDAARARKMAEMGINMMEGGGPGACKGQEECQTFCDDPDNLEECMNFAVRIGDMTPEEAEQVRQGIQMREQMMACLPLSCSEALTCLQSLSPGGPEGEQGTEQGGGENDEIQAKIEACIQEMMPEGPSANEAGMMPPEEEMMLPSPEEMEGMIQEEIQRRTEEETQRMMEQQMEQQIEQQMQQFAPPPTEQPQSFFDQVKNFLASLIKI